MIAEQTISVPDCSRGKLSEWDKDQRSQGSNPSRFHNVTLEAIAALDQPCVGTGKYGRVCDSRGGRARQGAGKGRGRILCCGNSRALPAVWILGLLGEAAFADLRRRDSDAPAAPRHAGRVRHIQSAIPDAGARRPAYRSGAGIIGTAPAKPVLPHVAGGCARPHQGWRTDLRRLRKAGRVSRRFIRQR